MQILESLYADEKDAGRRTTVVDGGGGLGVGQQQPQQAKVDLAEPNNPQLAAAMCQFEGMKKTSPQPSPAPELPAVGGARDSLSLTRMRDSLNGDKSLMDLSCLFSLSSINNLVNNSKTDRKTIESVLTTEIIDLIRMSEPQLEEIERLTASMPGSFSFDAAGGDRVSALRMTDVGMRQTQDGSVALSPPAAAGAPGEVPLRGTDASLMARSIMTIGTADMTTMTGVDGTGGSKKRTAAELSKSITDRNSGAEILAGLKAEGDAMDV